MHFIATSLPGAWIIEPEPIADERGSFQRTYCEREFAAAGLAIRYPQHSTSTSARAGTLRGLHFQRPPSAEIKIVTCLRGALHDVIVDLRAGSPTYGRSAAFTLSAMNRRQLYVPKGFAHGFQTLVDDTVAGYLISEFFAPETAGGLRHDDPALDIAWPLPVTAISERDRTLPHLADLTPLSVGE